MDSFNTNNTNVLTTTDSPSQAAAGGEPKDHTGRDHIAVNISEDIHDGYSRDKRNDVMGRRKNSVDDTAHTGGTTNLTMSARSKGYGTDRTDVPAPPEPSWHVMTVEATLERLGLHADVGKNGLSSNAAESRLAKFGPNQLTEKKKRTLLERIWAQVNNLLVAILVVVAVVSAVRAITATDSNNIVTNWIQVGLIAGVITLNTWIGLIQEGSAERAAEALHAMLSSNAKVMRDSVETEIPAKDLVPGDLVILSLGDRVPADMRMVRVANLSCQEAALTGESLAVDKFSHPIKCGEDGEDGDPSQVPLGDRKNMCFSATLVAQGGGIGIVVSTGDNTQIGHINALVNKVEKKKTNVLKQIDHVSKILAFFISLTAIITFLVAFLKTGLSAIDSVSIALVCAVAMIPEGLEAIVTLTYAWAVSDMARHNAIVRILPAVETLGSVTVICSDKTGTLTKNEMSLTAFVTSNARYRVDVNSSERQSSNFVRNDSYMVERAEHRKYRRAVSLMTTQHSIRDRKRSKSTLRNTMSDLFGRSRTYSSSSKKALSASTRSKQSERSGRDIDEIGLSIDDEEQLSSHPSESHKQDAGTVETEPSSSGYPTPDRTDSTEDGAASKTDSKTAPPQKNVTFRTGDDDDDDTNVPVADGESPKLEFLRGALAGGILCSKGKLGEGGGKEGEIGNPTELAILRAAHFGGVEIKEMRSSAPFVTEVPFSSEYKFMATVHSPIEEVDGPGMKGRLIVHVKGAPDRIIPLCSRQAHAGLVDEDNARLINKDYWTEQVAILSSHGLRVLALCRGSVPEESVQPGQQLGPEFIQESHDGPWLTIVGLCAIMDPPRPECVDAIKEAHGAGVRVAMITGDHRDTALAIGNMLGLVDSEHSEALTGPELDAMDDDDLRSAVMTHNIFARASPHNKIRIVKALQAEGQVCGMTGDGVNDAPALKAADMGVAMGLEGTDVAREAAEMILADDNFATIVEAVRQGRVVWDNLRKVLLVNTPINNAQGMSVLFGMVCGLDDTLLTPIQVLYCNLICAVTLGFVTAVEPAEDGIMREPPRRVGKRLIGRYLLLRIAIGTATLVTTTVGAVFWVRSLGYELGEMRSQASNTLTFGAISICLSARFSYNSAIHKRSLFGNKYAWYSVGVVALLQVCITYIPGLNTTIFSMDPQDARQWGIVILFMIVTFIVMETEKTVRRTLKERGRDTDDLKPDEFFDEKVEPHKAGERLVPKGASTLKLTELRP